MDDLNYRALQWALGEHTGVSSKTLCGHMLGIDVAWKSPPSDADDRSRCIRLLQLIPEWESRLDEMADEPSPERLVISGRGMNVERNGWAEQVPLIRAEMAAQPQQPKEKGEV